MDSGLILPQVRVAYVFLSEIGFSLFRLLSFKPFSAPSLTRVCVCVYDGLVFRLPLCMQGVTLFM